MAENQDISDEQLQNELKFYGNPIIKFNSKNRAIYIKKLNHFRARENKTTKLEEENEKKRTPGKKGRHSIASSINQRRNILAYDELKPINHKVSEESEDETDETSADEEIFTHEKQLRRRTIHISTPIKIQNQLNNRTKSPKPSKILNQAHLSNMANFSTSTPILEENISSAIQTSNNISPMFTSRNINTGLYPSNYNKQPINNFDHTKTNKINYLKTDLPEPTLITYDYSRNNEVDQLKTDLNKSKTNNMNSSITKLFDNLFKQFSLKNKNLPDFKPSETNNYRTIQNDFSDSDSEFVPYVQRNKNEGSSTKYASSFYAPKNHQFQSSNENFESLNKKTKLVSKGVLLGFLFAFGIFAIVYIYRAYFEETSFNFNMADEELCISSEGKEKQMCLNSGERLAFSDLLLMLATRKGEEICGSIESSNDAWVSTTELINVMGKMHEDVGLEEHYTISLIRMFKMLLSNDQFNIKLSNRDKNEIADAKKVFYVSSKDAIMSLLCRIKRSFKFVTLNIIIIFISILCSLGFIWLAIQLKRYQDRKVREVNSMANEIIELIKNHSQHFKKDPSLKPYLSLAQVRDSLIPYSQRKSKKSVWNKALKLISTNESRLREEIQPVSGEDTVVWRWIDDTLDLYTREKKNQGVENAGLENKGSLGSRLDGQKKLKNFGAFDQKLQTSCLKVFNLIDTSIHGNQVPEEMKDSILDRCGQYHGILHIGCSHKMEENALFIKCVTESAAGQNYKSLHAWTYEDRSINVKYVSPLIYKMIFEEDSENAKLPLKSTSQRLKGLREDNCRSRQTFHTPPLSFTTTVDTGLGTFFSF